MKARLYRLFSRNNFYFIVIACCLLIQVGISILHTNPQAVEYYYSRGFYPKFSYLSILLFSWLPFSFGDLLYGVLVLLFSSLLFRIAQALYRSEWNMLKRKTVQFLALLSLVYTFFYVNWGLNYYRIPLADQIGLDTESIHIDDYIQVVDKYVLIVNSLRDSLDLEQKDKRGVRRDLEQWMRADTLFHGILSQSQIHGKSPISSAIISYFTVSGYFNPFTLEVQVNQNIPLASYPFVNVHELAHQMGIGFEDECNFIAFRKLMYHKDLWYRYSAYYEAVQYLLYPLYGDKELYEKYRNKLSPKVRADLAYERAFWQQYSGWVDKISNLFYNQYLKHNNQPEGMERYSMMAKLVVAWEKQQGKAAVIRD
ncbi:DUF3810 domain-containing protein [Sphingobacterium sp. SGG-5]|uniref:DUF3810 domain-containing protein n=1 Tax=Sphingobacterium sp. SGG-5 TaxID=2710881 RepID=UPI0013ED03FD|nr:DUF3810 domain-containing protein [Sphingobacterium sp. SGG-5]NGM61662.1 DUF3810 domain-containing protein [Sphingobacterium sp. SGG-5]